MRLTANVYMQLYGYGISSFLKERTQCSCMGYVAGRQGAVEQQSLRRLCCGKTCLMQTPEVYFHA